VAIGVVVGRNYDLNTLMLVVLLVEQMLTTGGGWQDQIGGCYPGFKIGSSADSLPLKLQVQTIETRNEFISAFNDHIAIIHTG
jgi:fucokinase